MLIFLLLCILANSVILVFAQEDSLENSEEPHASWFDKVLSVFGVGGYAKYKLALNNEDPSYCVGISSNFWQAECLEETIQFNEDPKLCDKIGEDNIEANRARDECYIDVAVMENDISYCDFVGNDEERCYEIADYYAKEEGVNKEKEFDECVSLINNTKNRCRIRFASETEDLSICSNLLDIPQSLYEGNWMIYDEEYCMDSIAMKIKDVSLCKTSECITQILRGTQNYGDCSRILDSEISISRWGPNEKVKDVQYDFCLLQSENPQACFEICGDKVPCFRSAAERTNNTSWCSLIAPHDPKDFGNKVCTGAPDDPSRICEYTEG